MTDVAVRALVAVDTGLSPDSIEANLPQDSDFKIVGVVEGMDDALRQLHESDVDLLLVACLGYSDRALALIDGAERQNPARPIVVLSQGSPNGFLRRAFQAGADDILPLPQSAEQIRFAVQKVLARGHGGPAEGGVTIAPLVCVLGPKGGTGKTLTAANLAVSLAELGQRVVIVDLDLQFGDVALCLGLSPEQTIYDLANSGGSLDWDKLESFLVEHPSGVRALLAPRRPDQASAVSTELIREIYALLRTNVDYVVVDTPPGFTAEVIATIDNSSDVVVVGMLDSLSLKNTKLGLETLDLMGYSSDRIRLVLNRAHSRVGISQSEVVTILGREPDVLVPSDRAIPVAVNEGIPIAIARPQSEPAQAFRELAASFVGTAPVTPDNGDKSSSSLFAKLFKRKA